MTVTEPSITEEETQVVEPVNQENEVSETHEETSDDSDRETEDEEELPFDFPSLSLKDDTNLFVVTVDGVAKFYTKTLEEARSRMWDCARVKRFQEMNYNTYIREGHDPNRIEVVGCHRFYAVSYDRALCYLTVSNIQEIQEVQSPPTDNSEAVAEQETRSWYHALLG